MWIVLGVVCSVQCAVCIVQCAECSVHLYMWIVLGVVCSRVEESIILSLVDKWGRTALH